MQKGVCIFNEKKSNKLQILKIYSVRKKQKKIKNEKLEN